MRISALLRSFGKWALRLAAVALLAVVIYLLGALILTAIPSNSHAKQPGQGITIYLIANDVHVDICLPHVRGDSTWENFLPISDLQRTEVQYLAFGRGDKAFYLQTPEWKDLKPGIALGAMFWPTPSALHVTAYARRPEPGEYIRPVRLSPQQYSTMVRMIQAAFAIDTFDRPIPIGSRGYQVSGDRFYQATGSYHAFCNSNSWTNTLLKKCGIHTALWTPFSAGVLSYFPLDNSTDKN